MTTYTTVLHSDIVSYGIECAYTIANMDSLRRNNPRPDGGVVYLYRLALQHGLVENEPAFRRLIKKMVEKGAITITKKRMGATNINVYHLTDAVLNNPDRIALTKSRDSKTNTFTNPEKAVKASERKRIMQNQTTWQNTPDMPAPSSPEFVEEKAVSVVEAVTKRTVIPKGVYKATDNGSEVLVVSDGVNVPLMAQTRYKAAVNDIYKKLNMPLDFHVTDV